MHDPRQHRQNRVGTVGPLGTHQARVLDHGIHEPACNDDGAWRQCGQFDRALLHQQDRLEGIDTGSPRATMMPR